MYVIVRNEFKLNNGDFFFSFLQGSYKSKATFYGKSTPENPVGCMEFEFTFVKGH